jgi:prophage regulatory protein
MHAQPHTSAGASSAALRILRLPTVMRVTGLGRSTIYRMIAGDKFPRPVRIGERAVAWRESDVADWSESRSQTP